MRPTTGTAKLNKTALTIRSILGILLLVAALGISQILVSTRKEPPRVQRASSSLLVRTMVASPVPVVRTWIGYGAARSMQSAEIAAEVAGVVVDRPVSIEAGASVQAGDVLVQLEREEYEQILRRVGQAHAALRAELESLDVERESLIASLELADEAVGITEREVRRLRDAQARGAATETELERLLRDLTRVRREAEDYRQRLNLLPTRRAALEARLAVEQAQESIASLNVSRTTIAAPFPGRIVEVNVDTGERVAPGQVIARLVDLSHLETPLQAPVSAASSVRVGDDVTLTADGPSGDTWTGRIARVSPEADPTNRTVTVFVEIRQDPDGPDPLLRPGQFVIGYIAAGGATSKIIVPRSAVSDDRVFIVDSAGLAQPRSVRIGHFVDRPYPELALDVTEWAVIESGLSAGDRVVISNIDDLEAGAPVEARDDALETAS